MLFRSRTYFEDRGIYVTCGGQSVIYANITSGMKKFTNMFKPFDIEFQPFIQEIDVKEVVIQKCADVATMERIKGTIERIQGTILRIVLHIIVRET